MLNVRNSGNQFFAAERGIFRKDRPVLRDQAVTGVYAVGRGFVGTRIGVDVCGNKPSGRRFDKSAAIVFTTDGFGRSGQIDDDSCAHSRKLLGIRGHTPHGFADFTADDQIFLFVADEELMGAEHGVVAGEGKDDRMLFRERREPAEFGGVAVIRKRGFRNHAENMPVGDCNGAVVQLAVNLQRCADKGQHFLSGGVILDLFQRGQRIFNERIGQEKVAAGRAGEGKFGERENVNAGFVSLVNERGVSGDIFCRRGNEKLRLCRRQFDKSVIHKNLRVF